MKIPASTILERLASAGLVQEAPRVRTVFDYNHRPTRLAFPWVTTGKITWLPADTLNKYSIAFFHNEPWHQLDESVFDLFYPAPPFMHCHYPGVSCVGYENVDSVMRGEISASDVFFGTTNSFNRTDLMNIGIYRIGDGYEAMLDIQNPNKVLERRGAFTMMGWDNWPWT